MTEEPIDLPETETEPTTPTETKKPKTTRTTKAAKTAEPEATGKKYFRCSVPQDPTLPAKVIYAQTPGDAEHLYKAELGIVVLGSPISVSGYDDAE
jgi:hypothetical protein